MLRILRTWEANSSANLRANILQDVMFSHEMDIVRFTEQCGFNWSDMFSSWELVQRRALDGDLDAKAVVWRCKGSCGGLGDRQRGILTSFMLALVLDRAFFIDNEQPVPLRQFFHLAHPSLHWMFDERMLDGRTVLTEDFMNGTPPPGDYANANLSQYSQYDYIIQSNNFWQPFHILQNPHTPSRTSSFRRHEEHVLAGCLLNYLLVPNRDIQTQLQGVRESVALSNEKLLAIQIRTGDSQHKNLKVLNEFVQLFFDCVKVVQRASPTLLRVFLTTDSAQAVDMIQAEYPNLLTFDGEIYHVDGPFGSPVKPDAAFRKIVLDQMLISQADELIISRSGFAEFAALRGFKPYYTPVNCHVGRPIPHYALPTSQPTGVSGNDIDSLETMLAVLHDGNRS